MPCRLVFRRDGGAGVGVYVAVEFGHGGADIDADRVAGRAFAHLVVVDVDVLGGFAGRVDGGAGAGAVQEVVFDPDAGVLGAAVIPHDDRARGAPDGVVVGADGVVAEDEVMGSFADLRAVGVGAVGGGEIVDVGVLDVDAGAADVQVL